MFIKRDLSENILPKLVIGLLQRKTSVKRESTTAILMRCAQKPMIRLSVAARPATLEMERLVQVDNTQNTTVGLNIKT